jgi:light-regulated signal transduction histidine kinase (bacteriophytochrome)
LEGVLTKLKIAFEAGKDWEDTFLLKNKNGGYRWFLSRAIPFRNKQGEIVQWFGTNTDVSQQKETQDALNMLTASLEEKVRVRTEELMTKNTELELMNEELSSFSFVASHDLQEPLRKIQSFSSRILELETFSEKTEDYFKRIIAAGERMQNLINDLLSFSRTNTMELDFFPCDLNHILKEAKNFHVESIQEKNAIIESEVLPIVNGINVLFSQLFSNLIGNSIKYSQLGNPPHIKITSKLMQGKNVDLANVMREKEYYCITFADNGIGFQQEYAEKIFKLFQRLHRKEDFSGTGIGLTICKKIVTRLNGFITAKGEPNVGAIFKVYFPK